MRTRAGWRPVCCILGVLTALAALAPRPADGQAGGLDRVEALIDADRYDDARSTLDAWWTANESARVPGADRARALMLRARLAGDPAEAENHYLSIVFGYPISPEAPQALLRLGQALLAVGEAPRAAGYLQRLVADYPGRPERNLGQLWLARAQRAERQHAQACATAREGLRDARDPDLATMFRDEEAAACAVAGTGARAGDGAARTDPVPPPAITPATPPATTTPPLAAAPPATPGRTAPARAEATPPARAAGGGRFAAQAGAYRQQDSVDDAMARLRRAGYEPRAVMIPGSQLIRVRVGRLATAAEAAALVNRLKADRFDAVVVNDADRER
jgi:cell division septation protein DedD